MDWMLSLQALPMDCLLQIITDVPSPHHFWSCFLPSPVARWRSRWDPHAAPPLLIIATFILPQSTPAFLPPMAIHYSHHRPVAIVSTLIRATFHPPPVATNHHCHCFLHHHHWPASLKATHHHGLPLIYRDMAAAPPPRPSPECCPLPGSSSFSSSYHLSHPMKIRYLGINPPKTRLWHATCDRIYMHQQPRNNQSEDPMFRI